MDCAEDLFCPLRLHRNLKRTRLKDNTSDNQRQLTNIHRLEISLESFILGRTIADEPDLEGSAGPCEQPLAAVWDSTELPVMLSGFRQGVHLKKLTAAAVTGAIVRLCGECSHSLTHLHIIIAAIDKRRIVSKIRSGEIELYGVSGRRTDLVFAFNRSQRSIREIRSLDGSVGRGVDSSAF